MERDKGETDIATAEVNSAVGGMDFEVAEGDPCGSSGRGICVTSFCS